MSPGVSQNDPDNGLELTVGFPLKPTKRGFPEKEETPAPALWELFKHQRVTGKAIKKSTKTQWSKVSHLPRHTPPPISHWLTDYAAPKVMPIPANGDPNETKLSQKDATRALLPMYGPLSTCLEGNKGQPLDSPPCLVSSHGTGDLRDP